jgi:hypothetical protein
MRDAASEINGDVAVAGVSTQAGERLVDSVAVR